ncbi:Com family DNA-binding transcriptional regulator [Halomonas eurihalina]
MAMDEIRCTQCNRKLARASYYQLIEIKCPRCGHINARATSSRPMPKESHCGHPDHSLDGRQTPPR